MTTTTQQAQPMHNVIQREEKAPRLVTFGRGGHGIEFAGNCRHESGYDRPENFFGPRKWWAHDYTTQRDASQFEGVPWVDMRPAVETSAGFSWAYRGPLVNVDLPPGGINRLGAVDPIMGRAMVESGGEFGALLIMQAAARLEKVAAGPLDYVDVWTFCAGWKKVGARVGIIKSGQFVECEALP